MRIPLHRYPLLSIAITLGLPAFSCTLLAQQPVGGLPTEGRALEQPVFIASRNTGLSNSSPSNMDFSEYVDDSVGQSPTEPRLNLKEFAAGDLVAWVGREPVLVGHIIDPKKASPELLQNPALEPQLRKMLAQIVIRKALAQRFIDEQVAGKTLKEREAASAQVNRKVAEMFYKEALPDMMKRQKCETEEEFHQILEKSNRTVQSLQYEWTENMLASQCVRSNVNSKPVIELNEMQDYYDEHIDEFKRNARARFEILTAEFSKYPSKQAALDAISEMGNQVFFGNPFENVAKSMSTGWTASQGGKMDWTTKDSLKSKQIDEAIFSLPMNKLSQVIEDSEGYHIVRVIERTDALTLSFSEVQSEIRKKLTEEKTKKLEKEFLDKVRAETPIWTRWPEDFPGSLPLSQLYQ
ncbi:MAG: peptidylprolyl isomerase [Pirellula sp.]|jgi:parvulin-like peptidyl-prolyl isomerase|nr:peptidylprolyl isomerase [Pirellula sp.]